MRPGDAVGAAADALRANPLRSGLTTLGIVIGVGAVVAMVAVGAGARDRIERAIQDIGSNLLVVGNGSQSVAGRETGRGVVLSLTEADAAALARDIPAVQVAAGSVAGNAQIVVGNRNWFTTLRGVTPEYFEARNWRVEAGRNLGPQDVSGAARLAVLGATVAEKLFGDASPLGQQVRVGRAPFTVIGVMAAKGPAPWGGDQDDVAFVPLSTAKQRVFGGRQARRDLLGQITVKAISAEMVASAELEIAEFLRRRHRIGPGEPDDFFVSNIAEVMRARVESSRVMGALLAAVAGISLLVGGIGVMNIMLVSVTERTREIGLRMAVGARRRDIMLQFVIEALMLSVIGGLAGIALGVAGSAAIARVAGWPIVIGPAAVLIATGLAALIGVIFGYWPARKAARLDPLEALRQE